MTKLTSCKKYNLAISSMAVRTGMATSSESQILLTGPVPMFHSDDMGRGPWALTGTEVRYLRVFLDRLSSSGITVWPKPSELWVNGLKVHQYHVTWLAALSLGLTSPSLAVLRSRAELVQAVKQMEDLVQPAYMCIKRERSKLSLHALFPEDDTKQPIQGTNMGRLRDVFCEEDRTSRGTFAQELGIHPPRWFAQPFIPQIRYLGELRVIIINGIILHRVYTTPATLSQDDEGVHACFTTQLGYHVIDSRHVR
jgi:hypothetical protein